MLFISNFRSHKIVIQPDRTTYDPFGNPRLMPGIVAQFSDYKFETEDKKLIAALKNHPDFGLDFRSQDSVEETEMGKRNTAVEKRAAEGLVTSCTMPNCAWKGKSEKELRKHLADKHAQPIEAGESEDDPLE